VIVHSYCYTDEISWIVDNYTYIEGKNQYLSNVGIHV